MPQYVAPACVPRLRSPSRKKPVRRTALREASENQILRGKMKMALNRKVSAAAMLAATAGVIALLLLAPGNKTSALVRGANAPERTPVIEIEASEFRFSPSQITLKKGEPVILRLSSTDREHGLLLRAFKIDKEIPAGKTIDIAVTPKSVGQYTGICNHYCGTGHGGMKLRLTVIE